MPVRGTSRALAIAGLTGMGITAFATPALAVEVVNCTDPATTVELEGNGPWQFNTVVNCQPNPEISIAQTDADLIDHVTVFSEPSNGVFDGTFTSDNTIYANGDWNPLNPWTLTTDGAEVTYGGDATSGTIVVEFKKNGDPNERQTFEITLSGGGGGDGGGGGGGGDGGDGSGDGSGDGGDTPSGDSGSTDAVSGLGPHIQEFAMPETGTCDEAQSEGLNWGGAASGGWGESWAQWMNDGEGGFVCTRTLAYNTSTAAWEVE